MSDKAFFSYDAMVNELEIDEGTRLRLYTDTSRSPNMSIGTGRNLTANGISRDECELMLHNDITRAVASLDRVLPWWRGLPPAHARVMVNLTFNMGIGGLQTFRVFLAAMNRHDWQAAAAALRDSEWFKQVGSRGPRMIARLIGDNDLPTT